MKALETNRSVGADIATPVLVNPVTADELASLLRTQLDSMGLGRIRRNDGAMVLRRFQLFLATLPSPCPVMNESLIGAFEDWMVASSPSDRRYCRKFASAVRSMVNSLPVSVRHRNLLTKRDVKRLARFSEFSPDTGKLLERFLADGRKVKRTSAGLASTSILLQPSVRQNATYAAAMILRLVGLDDICAFGAEHADQYLQRCGENGRDTAIHTLWNVRCLFRWLTATGAIQEDPLAGIGRHRTRADTDFVPANQIAKLADLSTLDFDSFRDVRDRLIIYALCYDYALRIGEVGRLRLDDVRVTDFVEVGLRGEIQKGSGKPAITLRNLFPESKTLFEAYLRLRGPVGTGTPSLLVSEDGRPLRLSGCRNAVKRVSRALGITTDGGKTPAPHRYRHSMGTLNVGELGMRLTPYYLMRRYRHNDIRTTMQVYVTSNPLLDEAQHVAIVGAANGNGHSMASQPEPQAMALDIQVPEMEAMTKVRSL